MQLDEFLDRLENVRPVGSDYSAQCPAHEDRRNSLSVTEDEVKILFYCHAGCDWKDVLKEMGLKPGQHYKDDSNMSSTYLYFNNQPEAVYDYIDEKGILVYQVMRFPGKKFRQRRPSPEGWVWNMDGVKRVPYNLPELSASLPHRPMSSVSRIVYIVEGEKDVDKLGEYSYLATCFVGGAGRGKFLARYVRWFINAHVVIIADKDEPGLAYAREIEDALTGVAASVKVVQAAVGKDVSDHLDAGKTLDELEEVASEQQ